MRDAGEDLLQAVRGQRFGTILADPPWRFQNKTGKVAPEHNRLNRYSTLTLDEISSLPVAEAAAETSHLYLWVPNALLPEGLAVMKAWGFSYKSNIVWHKIRKDGKPDGRGVGFYFRNVTELLLFGVRGKNARTLAPGRRQVNYLATQKREHSRKPDEQYEIIETCSPGPFLELFARGIRKGWECWGAEANGDYEPTWATCKSASSKAPANGHTFASVSLIGNCADSVPSSSAQLKAPAPRPSPQGERGKHPPFSVWGERQHEEGLPREHCGAARPKQPLAVLELCAGAGGQSLGLEQAGFEHRALIEIDADACRTLRHNRPNWHVLEADVTTFDATPYRGVDLVAAGLPCPPFSVAGQQRGEEDERNLFPAAFRIIQEVQPKAVLIENVRGLLDKRFDYYRKWIEFQLHKLGYKARFALLNAADFGLPQNRPRVFIIALPPRYVSAFEMPTERPLELTVGDVLFDLMKSEGWKGAKLWRKTASGIAPAIVGGSKKHGGPDLGPTRARAAWAALGVDGKGIANEPPSRHFSGLPRLTVPMAAKIQGFPDDWEFIGRKTAAYRQVGNALPPALAFEVAQSISAALQQTKALKLANNG